MKKLLCAAVSVLVIGVAGSAMADNIGCGVGTMVFPGADTTLKQILAATTNGCFGNQTFGITSGTVGCDKPASFASTPQLERFVAENMDALARDIAAGQGETLATVAELLQVPVAERAQVYAALQANFGRIYPSADVQSGQVIDAIIGVIS
jgi:hypothetical protein